MRKKAVNEEVRRKRGRRKKRELTLTGGDDTTARWVATPILSTACVAKMMVMTDVRVVARLW